LYFKILRRMINSTRTFPTYLKASLRWIELQTASSLKILLIIFATVCLFLPAISIAVGAGKQGAVDRATNCANVVMKSPSKPQWDDPPNRSFFNGDDLDIMLSWTHAQVTNPSPDTVPFETVQMCAEWSDLTKRGIGSNPPSARLLKLVLTKKTEQSSQFRIPLDGTFPLGIRKAIAIQVVSSKPDLIPSLAWEVRLSQRWHAFW
jgi:hypothetical protein